MTIGASDKDNAAMGQGDYAPVAMADALIDSDTPVATGVAHVEVVAPATLPEGYTFEAEVGSQTVTVTVPPGGVEEGQKFTAPIGGAAVAGATETPNLGAMAVPRVNVPVGNWKDHWCDCCKLGCCHQHLGASYCCTPIVMAQVMTRLKLNWLGDEGSSGLAASTFRINLVTFIIYVALNPLIAFSVWPGTTYTLMRNVIRYLYLIIAFATGKENPDVSSDIIFVSEVYFWIACVYNLVFLVYIVYAMTKTRRRLREKYAIPEMYCKSGIEDCCCSFWCSCCTAAQMARHTADYQTYAAMCCSETGVPPHVPSIV